MQVLDMAHWMKEHKPRDRYVKDPIQSLANLYIEKYGKYNYVSKSENKKLIKYQKIGVFKSPEKAYQSAGIELIDYEGFLNF